MEHAHLYRDGNKDAHGLLVYYPAVTRYVRNLVAPHYSSADIVQETYSRALTTIRNRGPPQRSLAWLLCIARRTSFHHIREETGHAERESVEPDANQIIDCEGRDPLETVVFLEDPYTFENVWHDPETLHLYSDHSSSRSDYFNRLERLFSRSVKLFGKSTQMSAITP